MACGAPYQAEFIGCAGPYAAATGHLLHDDKKARGVCGTPRLVTERDPLPKAGGIRVSGFVLVVVVIIPHLLLFGYPSTCART